MEALSSQWPFTVAYLQAVLHKGEINNLKHPPMVHNEGGKGISSMKILSHLNNIQCCT